MSEWIEWKGGKCPVPPKTRVETRLRNGHTDDTDTADAWAWKHTSEPWDIIAYRVVEDAQTTKATGGWIEWKGGECPVPEGTRVNIKFRGGYQYPTCPASHLDWNHNGVGGDIIAYHVVEGAPTGDLSGGQLKGDHYYTVRVKRPINPDLPPYIAECADIIEALNMTFNEGENFKALWRLAAGRQGRGKPGVSAKYNADKCGHYGGRVAAQNQDD